MGQIVDFWGLADYYIESASKEDLVKAWSRRIGVVDAIKQFLRCWKKFSARTRMPESKAAARELFIRKFEGVNTLKEFADILTNTSGRR